MIKFGPIELAYTDNFKRMKKRHQKVSFFHRRDRIRTCDLFVPNEALYQAEPHAVMICKIINRKLVYHIFIKNATHKLKFLCVAFLLLWNGYLECFGLASSSTLRYGAIIPSFMALPNLDLILGEERSMPTRYILRMVPLCFCGKSS